MPQILRLRGPRAVSEFRLAKLLASLQKLDPGVRSVAAEFWLLDAPTSIARQSERNADGYGLAALTSRRGMILIRNPVQASEDPAYRHVARRLDASEMLVHLRYASTGGVSNST